MYDIVQSVHSYEFCVALRHSLIDTDFSHTIRNLAALCSFVCTTFARHWKLETGTPSSATDVIVHTSPLCGANNYRFHILGPHGNTSYDQLVRSG